MPQFPGQTSRTCPLCNDPIFEDAELAEFRSAPGIAMHASCLETVGAERALAIVARQAAYDRALGEGRN